MFLIPFIAILTFFVGFFLYKHYIVKISRSQILKKAQNEIPIIREELKQHSQLFAHLKATDQDKLFEYIVIFIHEKKWGHNFAQGQKSYEALKACLPLIKKETNFYPQLKIIEKERSLRQWIGLHEKQFSVEIGKDFLHEFKGNFSVNAEEYFIDPAELKRHSPQLYLYLNHYFKLYSEF